ncbi:type II toxin-antitoxin system prevent-host-death family antitoxin (plasmid) [Streptomyces sp. NBC_01352]|uniref:type II toxin-antitoxin system prevent-host-death family antitoxin n=1 Tax=Streptomyces sp. NBC_01352 TaxID=2903834 RepID=UPI002E33C46D|nr:type II toxin-antitoxin system prevent-host-death family antitoxin [Streptomyces sp. NBC_01352]
MSTAPGDGADRHEIGLREARKELGDLAAAAQHGDRVTYLTRHGKAVAAVVPASAARSVSAMKREAERAALDRKQTEDLHEVQLDWTRRQFEIGLRAALRIAEALAHVDLDDVTRATLEREAASVRGFLAQARGASGGEEQRPGAPAGRAGRRRTLQDLRDGSESVPGQLDLLGGA